MASSKPKKTENLLEVIRKCILDGRYKDTSHAIKRKKERNIILPAIIQVLNTGWHEKTKDRFDEGFNSWSYSIRGFTIDGMDL